MPDEPISEDDNTIKLISKAPLILDKVNYVYSSYAQVSVNSMDFRIAFGDRLPPDGEVKPTVGIVMSHDHVKALLNVLSENVPKIDILMKEMAKQAGSTTQKNRTQT